MKILFICKERDTPEYHSNKFGLFNSASFVCNRLKHKFDTKIVSVIDSNCIDREVTQYKPDIVILEAIWVPPYKLEELTKIQRHKHVKWIIRIHSKATFLANEGIAFNWINQYVKLNNVIISANNKDFNKDLRELGYDAVYLPNIYNAEYGIKRTINHDNSVIKIGCFGALRPMKNQLSQAIAAIRFADLLGKKLEFHINYSRREQSGENVFKNLINLFEVSQHELVLHGWLNHHDFCKLCATMDIGMQVSLSESFNIVTADFVNVGIPVVTCDDISFVSQLFTAKANSTISMIISLCVARFTDYIRLQYINNYKLKSYNKAALKTWVKFLHSKH